MASSLTVSVVIPTKNEAKNLPHVLPRIPSIPEIAEVVLVDGGSTDGTVDVARELRPDIRVVQQTGRGKSDAIRCGIEAATGDFVLIIDADGSQPPEDIARFVDFAKQGYDLIKGSRYIPGGHSDDHSPLRRLLVSVTDGFANLLWGSNFTDIVYGMFMIRRPLFLSLGLDCQGFGLETQLMGRSQRRRFRIVQVPVVEAPRIHGESHLSVVTDGWHIGSTVFAEFGHRITRDIFLRRPAANSSTHQAS